MLTGLFVIIAFFIIFGLVLRIYSGNKVSHNSDDEPRPRRSPDVPDPIDVDVKGTFYRTPDEISAARACRVGDTLILEPEPFNKVDGTAVKVMTMEGFQIGYVSSDYSRLVKNNLNHIAQCVITRVSKHEIPFISIKITFSEGKVSQPDYIPKDYQCSPDDIMQNLATKTIDSYDYRRVPICVQDLYERDREVIAKARTCRKGDKIILKKGVCDEFYPDRIDIYLADGTYLGYADDLHRKEVYALFDNIVDAFVEAPIGSEFGDRLWVRVIFPNKVKCSSDCLFQVGISFHYDGNYPEVAKAREIRRTDPMAALNLLMPVVKTEKGIEAHLECVACYYQLKEWESRIGIIQETLDRIASLTEEDLPPSLLRRNQIEATNLYKQLEFSRKRLESQHKKSKK